MVSVESGPLAGKKFNGLLELMDAQALLRNKCKHIKRFREVESGLSGMKQSRRAWVRVRCSRCQAVLEFHSTPRLSTAVPN
jgi:phage FluMu protein Com